ncbi:MAG: type I DNA topoisomerase [Alphaproteobacteria bacterium]
MDVVVVESPAKAKTINKYLGSNYTVLASFGHVRDLPSKDGSVRPDEDFAMSWEVDIKAKKRLDDIAAALKGAKHLYLATDPDREGEAISWHVKQLLADRKVLNDIDVKRVVFNEITKDAVTEAIRNPRELDQSLIDAYLARRALDYLVGFTLSPVLWRKLPGSRSAGRVQSVALRLICERETEIELFRPEEYWTIDVDFLTPKNEKLTARLTHVGGERLGKMSLGNEKAASDAKALLESGNFAVTEVERKQVRRHPYPPFTTSTLQQEASRKLGFRASHTMRTAQQLYEGVTIGGETVGLITYMRTDSTNLANEAINSIRKLIGSQYGAPYLPDAPRIYKTKAKNAQEAHEAVRPTDIFRKPKDVAQYLDTDQAKLYELIWKRTVACEMESAVLDQVTVTIDDHAGKTSLRATGSVINFDGFLTLYSEDRDDPTEDEDPEGRRLPNVNKGDPMDRQDIRPEQHFTQPPPRYTEASLVRKLEELGIGRPSTYASIIQVLQDRKYVTLDKRRFLPEDRGRIVTTFLTNFFRRYVEYDFTAKLEDQLDDISGGRIDWKQVLRDFWTAFSEAVASTKELTITQVIDALDEALGPHFFVPASDGSGTDPRLCQTCGNGRLGIKLGKFGAFIGCSNYPDCRYTRPLQVANGNDDGRAAIGSDGKELGIDPASQHKVLLKVGPYGPYVQLGDGDLDKKEKPKRVAIPKGVNVAAVDLELALKLLALPRHICTHPESGKPITAGIGRFGPYIKHETTYKSLKTAEEMFTIGCNYAVELLSQVKPKAPALRDMGAHPADSKPVTVHEGRYGPYLKHGRTNASVPKGIAVEDLTLEQAITLLVARGGKPVKAAKPAKAPKEPKAAKPAAPAKPKPPKAPKAKAPKAKAKEPVES